MDFVYIGGTPAGEACVGVEPGVSYHNAMRQETRLYKLALLRVYGPPPFGAQLRVKTEHHDFGDYCEVVCEYDDNDATASEYAGAIEAGLELWEEAGLTVMHRRLGSHIELSVVDTRQFCYIRGLDDVTGIVRVHVDAAGEGDPVVRLERSDKRAGPWAPLDFEALPEPIRRELLVDARESAGPRIPASEAAMS